MRLIYSCTGAPLLAFGGGAMTSFNMLKRMLDLGHEVHVVYLEGPEFPVEKRGFYEAELKKLGVRSVRTLAFPVPRYKLLKQFTNMLEGLLKRFVGVRRFFQTWRGCRPQAEAICREIQPELILTYHFEPVEAFFNVRDVKKVAAFGNLMHMVERLRLRLFPEATIRYWAKRITYPFWEKHYLRSCKQLIGSLDRAWFNAANYAEYCQREFGQKHVVYCASPSEDEWVHAGSPKQVLPEMASEVFEVVMVGHLRGTATQSGLKFFAEKILPELKRRGFGHRFRFKIVGKFAPPAWLAEKLKGERVEYLGFVEDYFKVTNSATALLVPIPEDIGNRVRIVSAFSAYACVVSHLNSILGMPELVDGENCMLGANEIEIADKLIAVCQSRELNQKLRLGGRAAYDAVYTYQKSLARMDEVIFS